MLKVGILGVGAIGRSLASAIDQRRIDAELVALSDQERERAEAFAATLASRPPVVSLEELIERSDLAVEAASQAALREFVPRALARGRDVLVMSAGGLLGHDDWFREAAAKGCRIIVPSGAIAGLDGIKSAAMGRIESATLTSRKPVAALEGSAYVESRGLRLGELKAETTIFEGSAEEAARAFPATSNVAASLRLAAGPETPVRVRVVAVPGGTKNVHEIRVEGEFGRLSVTVENVPSKSNPRTSQLAAFSALATLAGLTRSLRVGT
ncbi:MAG: aspartate dehydrogenase [Candidatus Acidiferrales bacterium]